MLRWIAGRRPSAAMIVACAALSVAVGGTALAASGVFTKREKKVVKRIAKRKANKQIKKKAPKIADRVVTDRAPGLNVNSAKTATKATSADTATSANSAKDAAMLGGLAPGQYQQRIRWALVEGDQIAAQSGGVTLADHPEVGRYVLDFGSSVVDHALLTTPNFGGLDGDEVAIATCTDGPGGLPLAFGCDVNENRVLVDVEDSSGTNVDADFWVAVVK